MESTNRVGEIGVVIPTYNEELFVSELLADLHRENLEKIIVVDGGSSDQTIKIVSASDATLITSPKKGRGFQMNLGAQQLPTEYILFLHADVKIPMGFNKLLQQQLSLQDFDFANFQLRFISKHWFLKLNAVFSRTKQTAFQFGDQGLLIKSKLFHQTNGFNDTLLFMEGNEIIRRLRKKYLFRKLPIEISVSDRKYRKHGVYKLQFSYYLIFILERMGIPQWRIKELFHKILG